MRAETSVLKALRDSRGAFLFFLQMIFARSWKTVLRLMQSRCAKGYGNQLLR